MRRGATLVLAVLALTPIAYLAACSEGPVPRLPSRSAVAMLERQLAEHPCVGSLDRWERHYTFKSRPFLTDYVGRFLSGITLMRVSRWYDYRVIHVHLLGAGREALPHMELEATRPRIRRHALMPTYQWWIDDSGWPTLWGEYHIAADRLDVYMGCGRLLRPPPRD